MTVKKSVMQSGSYGICAPGPNSGGELVNVWFCGAWRLRQGGQWQKVAKSPGYHGNSSMPCVHRTKAEAIQCARSER